MVPAYQLQYNNAKSLAQTAITKGHHVVLYGKGCNGKSHLYNEIKNFITQHNYKRSFDLNEIQHGDSNVIENKYWVETNRLDIIDKYLSNEKLELINMNNYQYNLLDSSLNYCYK
tara:strand:- start:165 stop:509 length:345 start_codon:yes stop_codon:yes gene_type:complete